MNQFLDKRIRVFIIDQQKTFCDTVELLLADSKDFKLVGSSKYLVSKKFSETEVDLLIIDVTNFEEPEQKMLLTLKKGVNSEMMILALTSNVDASVFDILKFGLIGFLDKSKPNIHYNLLEALDKFKNNEITIGDGISKLIVESFHQNPICPLTTKEREIILRASKGMTYQLIAEDLTVTLETIKSHFKNIYSKLGVTSKYEAILQATSNSWV